MELTTAISVSELFGPTIQGEGLDIGRPCFFVRLHNCPVHCPGCDTHYTWDGSEKGTRSSLKEIQEYLDKGLTAYPGCGVVLSGGEPLLHYKNHDLVHMLTNIRYGIGTAPAQWISLETSGYMGKAIKEPNLFSNESGEDFTAFWNFLTVFTTIHLSPKITPCLHGRFSDEELLQNMPLFLKWSEDHPDKLALKFVVRDRDDLEAVRKVDCQYKLTQMGRKIYLMPYGVERDEILEVCHRIVEMLPPYGYILTPRLHSLLWGKRRGV